VAKKDSEISQFAGSLALKKSFGGGVYGIINLSSGKLYIGSTILFAGRFRSHLNDLTKQRARSIRLQYDFDLGFKFDFIIIESISPEDKESRLDREQFWMDFYQSHRPEFGYNICTNSRDHTGLKRRKETCQKLHETHAGKPHPWLRKPVVKLDFFGNEIERFASVVEASRSLGFDRPNGNIVSVMRGNQKTAYGFKWRYA
jgi:hypothetical protein